MQRNTNLHFTSSSLDDIFETYLIYIYSYKLLPWFNIYHLKMSSKLNPSSTSTGHSLNGYCNCPWLPICREAGMLSAFLKNHSVSSDRINIKNKQTSKKPVTYFSLGFCDFNLSHTFYTWTLIFQPFLHMLQAYVYTLSSSVKHTPLFLFIIYAHLNAQHAVFLHISSIHPAAPPERQAFSPKWN